MIEPPKRTLIMHGTRCPAPLSVVLKTIHSLRNPHSVMFHKKNDHIYPFESTESLEFLAGKNDCAIVVFGSSNKKRPNCVTIARIFNSKVLDMVELLLIPHPDTEALPPNIAFKMDIPIGARPMILFAGSAFEDATSSTYAMIKSMFLDLFKGEDTDKVNVEGLQFVMMVGADEPSEPGLNPVIHVRWYKLRTRRSGQKLPRVELEPMGPKFDFRVGRVRQADPDAMKEAMKQGKRPNEEPKTKKNIGMDAIGDKIGRIHVGKQDLNKLQTRKMKGLKRRAGEDSSDEESEGSEEEFDYDVSDDVISEDEESEGEEVDDMPSDIEMVDADDSEQQKGQSDGETRKRRRLA